VFGELGEAPHGKTCDAIIGIIEEGQKVMADFKGRPALDAGLLAPARPSSTTRLRAMERSRSGQRNSASWRRYSENCCCDWNRISYAGFLGNPKLQGGP
jgi:hypothetical protein